MAVRIEPVVVEDAELLGRHRSLMFVETGMMPEERFAAMAAACCAYYRWAIPDGEYRGWKAVDEATGRVAASGGFQLRAILPRPDSIEGREAIIVSMYTEPDYRRRGLGKQLVEVMLGACRALGVQRVTLHASQFGEPLYEQFGFRRTNEMRLIL